MKTFILILTLVGKPPAFLGTYDSMQACTNAIREIAMQGVFIGARDNETVKKAVDTYMLYQQDYKCIPQK